MRFEFATATRIIFGPDTLSELGSLVIPSGRRALVVTGGSASRAAILLNLLQAQQVETVLFQVRGEPTLDMVDEGVKIARDENCRLVIGFGGGSVIDTGKAVAAMVTNPGMLQDYLEIIGAGRSLEKSPLPFFAVPTTAGTGAEVTRNAVLLAPLHKVKVSLRSPLMLPCLALIDPCLTVSMPPAVTASTGLDALTQLIEPFISIKGSPLTATLCGEGIARVAASLHRAWIDGQDLPARMDMSLASLLGGMALANAGLGVVHALAGTLGGIYHAPHGALCAGLLPQALEVNARALAQRDPDSPARERLKQMAEILTGDRNAEAMGGIEAIRTLCRKLEVPSLAGYGIREADFATIIDMASRSSSMRGNPISLTGEELHRILQESL